MEWGSDHQSWEVGGSNFTLTIKHEDLILEMGNLAKKEGLSEQEWEFTEYNPAAQVWNSSRTFPLNQCWE
jgi:hypothetical protein